MLNVKYSGKVWAEMLGIHVLKPKGWESEDDFNHLLISKKEFCNRASNSDVKIDLDLNRRNASKLLENYKKL